MTSHSCLTVTATGVRHVLAGAYCYGCTCAGRCLLLRVYMCWQVPTATGVHVLAGAYCYGVYMCWQVPTATGCTCAGRCLLLRVYMCWQVPTATGVHVLAGAYCYGCTSCAVWYCRCNMLWELSARPSIFKPGTALLLVPHQRTRTAHWGI